MSGDYDLCCFSCSSRKPISKSTVDEIKTFMNLHNGHKIGLVYENDEIQDEFINIEYEVPELLKDFESMLHAWESWESLFIIKENDGVSDQDFIFNKKMRDIYRDMRCKMFVLKEKVTEIENSKQLLDNWKTKNE